MNPSIFDQSISEYVSKKKRKTSSIRYKQLIIKHFKKSNNKSLTGRIFGVLPSQVRRYVKKEDLYLKCKGNLKKRNLTNASNLKKSENPEIEKQLYEKIVESRKNHICVRPNNIRSEMLAFCKENGNLNFRASYGWLRRFMARYNLVFRRISGSGREFPNNSVEIINDYFKETRYFIESKKFTLNQIINFDETSFYMDMPGNYTLEMKGSRRARCKTTGKEKVRLSCIFSATASGIKLPILCVVPRKTELPNVNFPENVIVLYAVDGLYIYLI